MVLNANAILLLTRHVACEMKRMLLRSIYCYSVDRKKGCNWRAENLCTIRLDMATTTKAIPLEKQTKWSEWWKDGKSSNFVWRAVGGRRTEGGAIAPIMSYWGRRKENVFGTCHGSQRKCHRVIASHELLASLYLALGRYGDTDQMARRVVSTSLCWHHVA
jgi:hypothetical protein